MKQPTFDPKDGPLLSPREEAIRYRVASQRFRERIRTEPEYARQLLEEIGYFEMMADEESEAESSDGTSSNGADSA